MRAKNASRNGLFNRLSNGLSNGVPVQDGGNLKVSKNNGSLTHEGTQFSQQCFWISIVDWILVSQSEETLNKLGIGIPNDFKQSLTSEQTFNTNREFLLNAIKGLTKTKDSQKYRNIIEDTKQTRLDGTSGHEEVIQDFVNKTGLYINVFSIDPRNKNQLSLPKGKENANLTELSIHSLYSIGPEGNYMSPSGGGEGHNSRIFIVAYGYHFELITQYKDYNVSKQATIDQSLQKIIYSVPSWTYAIYKDFNELTDAQNIDSNSSDVIIEVFFDSLVTAIDKILKPSGESPNEQQIYHLPVLGAEFADMLTKLKESEDKKALYKKYSKIYYGGEGNEDSPTEDGLMIQIRLALETSESPSSKDNVILSDQNIQQLKELLDKLELRDQILQEISAEIKEYITKKGTQNMFVKNKDDLKTAIQQKLPREQLSEEQIGQISDHVSDLLQSYLQYSPNYVNIYNTNIKTEDILKKLGNFFEFLKNLDEEKLALGVVND